MSVLRCFSRPRVARRHQSNLSSTRGTDSNRLAVSLYYYVHINSIWYLSPGVWVPRAVLRSPRREYSKLPAKSELSVYKEFNFSALGNGKSLRFQTAVNLFVSKLSIYLNR